MKYLIRIFCNDSGPINLREITEAAEEGEFLMEDPRFDPDPRVQGTDVADWKSVVLTWDSQKSPIIFSNHAQDEQCRAEIRELSHILSISRRSKPAEKVADHLKGTVRMLEIEMDREQLTEEAWAMLDAIEARIAMKHGGIIYTQDGIFFDGKLKRIYKL